MILDLGLAVRLVVSVRSSMAQVKGCPEWEGPGVQAALIGTEGSPGAVLAAALLAAEDASLRLPSVNAFKAHWPKNAGVAPPAISHNVRCIDHPTHDMPCPHLDHHGQMTIDEIAEAKAAVLAQIKPYTPRIPGTPKETP